MREIKFRAWDNEFKKMELWNHLKTYTFEDIESAIDNSEKGLYLMQYTGLKDKNGKEIYEGDIISDNEIIGLVEWINDKCSFDVKIDGEYFSDYLCDYVDCEVIGNIYENPELLNANEVKKKRGWGRSYGYNKNVKEVKEE